MEASDKGFTSAFGGLIYIYIYIQYNSELNSAFWSWQNMLCWEGGNEDVRKRKVNTQPFYFRAHYPHQFLTTEWSPAHGQL